MPYDEFIAWLREEWPHSPEYVLARLKHTLDVFDSPHLETPPPDEDLVIQATGGVYQDEAGNPIKTGLTWGDLRLIRDYLDHQWREESARPMAPILVIPLENFGPGKRPTIR